jgi:hypothetical protein
MCIGKRDGRSSAASAKALLVPMVARLRGGRKEIKRKFGEFTRRDGAKENARVCDGTLLIIALLTILLLSESSSMLCSLFLSLFLFIFLSLSLFLSIFLSLSLFLFLFLFPFLSLFLFLFLFILPDSILRVWVPAYLPMN